MVKSLDLESVALMKLSLGRSPFHNSVHMQEITHG
jgi:hypothetical protein